MIIFWCKYGSTYTKHSSREPYLPQGIVDLSPAFIKDHPFY